MNPLQIRQAASCVLEGGIIAYPTEAVYGLGCDPLDEQAVLRILALKRRKISKGLIVVAAALSQLEEILDLSKLDNLGAIQATWPGPVTWLLPLNKPVPYWLTGEHDSLAVRISANHVVKALCLACGPLVSSSANPAQAEPARSASRVRAYFGRHIDHILPGEINNQYQPSEIRDARTGHIIRL